MTNLPNSNRPDDPLPLPVVARPETNGTPAAAASQGALPLAPRRMLPPESPPFAPNALNLLKALRRRWLLATTLGVVAAATVAAAVWFFLPPGNHTAYIRLYMPAKPETVFSRPDLGDFHSFQRTQMTVMKSRLVLNAALKDPKVARLDLAPVTKSISPVEWLEKEVKVDLTDGPELPRVTMSGDDPERIKILVTAVVDAYLAEFTDKQAARRREHLDLLQGIADKYDRRLKAIEAVRSKFEDELGPNNHTITADKLKITREQLAMDQHDLVSLGREIMKMKTELDWRLKEGKGEVSSDVPEKLIDDALDEKLKADLAARTLVEERLKAARERVDDDANPVIRGYLKQIDDMNAALAKQREKLRPAVKAGLHGMTRNDANARVEFLKEQVKLNAEFKDMLQKEIDRLEEGLQKDNANALKLDRTQSDYDQAKKGVERVMAEIDKENFEAPAPPRVSKLDPEVIVVSPEERTRKLRTAGMGAAGTLGGVLLLVAFLEFRARRLDSAEEVVRGLGLNIVGSLPAAPRRFGGRLMSSGATTTADWQYLLAESVDSARTLLLRVAETTGTRVVMITSASSGEGKTSLATHLAASLARAGHKTLLIDGDLRKPAAHHIFDLPLVPGLSEFLRGEVDLALAVRPTHAPGLWLLPAGACDGGAIQLLAGGAFQGLLGRLKPEYEFIVLDSCPVLAAADALILAQHVDGILLSLLHEVSRLPRVYAACQRLSMLSAPMLGAVINGTRADDHVYGPYVPKAKTA